MTLESIKQITVDLSKSDVYNDNITAMQGDNGTRYVYVTVLNNGQTVDLTDTYPVLRGTKSDGKTIFNQCEIVDGKIVVELTQNILAAPGIGRFEIALYDLFPVEGEPNGKIIAAFPFNINVIKSSFDAVNIVSSDEYTVLAEAMESIPSVAELQNFEAKVTAIEGQIGNHTVGKDVPADAVFTDTTYEKATALSDGLESKEHYSKIEGIAVGAEVNQNAFSHVIVGESSISANSKTASFGIRAGENTTVEIDSQNREVVISSTGGGGETTTIQESEYDNCINVNGEDIVVSKNLKLNAENGDVSMSDMYKDNGAVIDTYVTANQELKKFNLLLKPIQENKYKYLEPSYEGNGRNVLNLSLQTQTIDGVTFTVNADKTITLSGEASADVSLVISNLCTDQLYEYDSYAFSCMPINDKNCRMYVWDGSDVDSKVYDDGNGIPEFEVTSNDCEMVVTIPNGTDATGIILKPMAVYANNAADGVPWKYEDFTPYTNIVPFILRDYEDDGENEPVIIRKIKNKVVELNDLDATIVDKITIDYDEILDGNYDPYYYGMKIDLINKVAYPFKYIASYNYETIGDIWYSNKACSSYTSEPPEGAEVVYLDTSDEIDVSSYLHFDNASTYANVEEGYLTMFTSYGNSDEDYKTTDKEIIINEYEGSAHSKATYHYVDECTAIEIEYLSGTNKIHIKAGSFCFGDEVQEDHYADNVKIDINPFKYIYNGYSYVGGYYGEVSFTCPKSTYDEFTENDSNRKIVFVANEKCFDYKCYCRYDSKYYKYNYYCAQYTGYYPNGFESYSNYILVAYRYVQGDTSYTLFYYDPDADELKPTSSQDQNFVDNSCSVQIYPEDYRTVPVQVNENMNICNICCYEDSASALAYAQHAYAHSIADSAGYSAGTARFYGGHFDVDKGWFYPYDYMPAYNGQALTRDYDINSNAYYGDVKVKWFQKDKCYLDGYEPTVGEPIVFYRPNAKPYIIKNMKYEDQYYSVELKPFEMKLLVTKGGEVYFTGAYPEYYDVYPYSKCPMTITSFDYYKNYEANLNSQKTLTESVMKLKHYVDNLVLSAINGTY